MARRALGPRTLAVVRAVDRALGGDDSGWLVACSGGADSLALAAATSHLARRRGRTVAAVVVDHGLQESSAAVAERARAQLDILGYGDATVVRVEVDPTAGMGLEAAAREARYRALRREAERREAVVLLGHTRDDQAETVLLGLARGSGTRSLAGMPARHGRLRRPLLELRRADTEAACVELGLQPWPDPHNVDPAYARSRTRHRVLPVLESELGPGIAAALVRTAQLSRDDADLLDQLAAAADPGTDTLDSRQVGDLPAAIRRRVLRRWLMRHGATDLGFAHIARVEDLLSNWHGQRHLDLPGVVVTRSAGRLLVQRRPHVT